MERLAATALEHEWGDVLFPGECLTKDQFGEPLGETHQPLYSPFYSEAAALLCETLNPSPATFLEAGASCGRFAYELLRAVPSIQAATLCEPESPKMNYASLFLKGGEITTEVPVILSHLEAGKRMVTTEIEGLSCDLTFQPRRLEETARERFDIVAALNVIDRVKYPKDWLAKELIPRLNPGGLLVISTPFDWHDTITPMANWFEDLRPLLTPYGQILRSERLLFPYRSRTYRLILFTAQLIVLQVDGNS